RSFQRRRPRHHYHDHGSRIAHSGEFAALTSVLPVFLSYVLSFIYVGIYWNNHHHLLHSTKHVSAGILWANLHLLVTHARLIATGSCHCIFSTSAVKPGESSIVSLAVAVGMPVTRHPPHKTV